MLQSKTIEMDGIGLVLLERSKRASRLNISVKPITGTRVGVPYGLSFESAEKMALSKATWIKRRLDKVKEIEKRQAAISNLWKLGLPMLHSPPIHPPFQIAFYSLWMLYTVQGIILES